MKGYCSKCDILIDETEIVHHICEFWIDGTFVEWWTGKSYYCHDRHIFVPKFATIRNDQEKKRIYIDENFALKQGTELKKLKDNMRFRHSDGKHVLLDFFVRALNVPWEPEPYVEPRIKTSLW